jgi:hypothetical protein
MKLPPRRVSRADIRRARVRRPTDFGNDRLYELCRRYPGHNEPSHSIAKVWLIGRAYSAAIERGSTVEGAGRLWEIVGRAMRKSRLDRLLHILPDGRSPWPERLAGAVQVHEYLMGVWASKGAKGKRSLASKYLRFHRRDIFPMFDSFASSAIRKVTPDKAHVDRFPVAKGDTTYKAFCERYAWLLQHIRRKFNVRLTLRQVDRLLLAIAKETRNRSRHPTRGPRRTAVVERERLMTRHLH